MRALLLPLLALMLAAAPARAEGLRRGLGLSHPVLLRAVTGLPGGGALLAGQHSRSGQAQAILLGYDPGREVAELLGLDFTGAGFAVRQSEFHALALGAAGPLAAGSLSGQQHGAARRSPLLFWAGARALAYDMDRDGGFEALTPDGAGWLAQGLLDPATPWDAPRPFIVRLDAEGTVLAAAALDLPADGFAVARLAEGQLLAAAGEFLIWLDDDLTPRRAARLPGHVIAKLAGGAGVWLAGAGPDGPFLAHMDAGGALTPFLTAAEAPDAGISSLLPLPDGGVMAGGWWGTAATEWWKPDWAFATRLDAGGQTQWTRGIDDITPHLAAAMAPRAGGLWLLTPAAALPGAGGPPRPAASENLWLTALDDDGACPPGCAERFGLFRLAPSPPPALDAAPPPAAEPLTLTPRALQWSTTPDRVSLVTPRGPQ